MPSFFEVSRSDATGTSRGEKRPSNASVEVTPYWKNDLDGERPRLE